MDLFVAGRDQSAADQPNNLAEGHPLYIVTISLVNLVARRFPGRKKTSLLTNSENDKSGLITQSQI